MKSHVRKSKGWTFLFSDEFTDWMKSEFVKENTDNVNFALCEMFNMAVI